MSTFSQRLGVSENKPVQTESMDDDLRVSLWNAVNLYFWSKRDLPQDTGSNGPSDTFTDQPLRRVVSALWIHHLKWPLDELSDTWSQINKRLRDYFFSALWHEVYDFIEYLTPEADRLRDSSSARFMGFCNGVLTRENAGFRFVSGRLVPITSDSEISEIEKALRSPSDAVRTHLQTAVMLIADKENADLDGATLASLQAVEAAVRLIDDDPNASFVEAMQRVRSKVGLRCALDDNFLRLCGLTYNEAGFYHSLNEKPRQTSPDDARFILVTCSAFANYLISLARQTNTIQ